MKFLFFKGTSSPERNIIDESVFDLGILERCENGLEPMIGIAHIRPT